MPGPHRITAVVTTQGFDQFESRIALTEKSGFQLALLPFRPGHRVGHNAAADTQRPLPVHSQLQRTNRHVEPEVAIRLEPAEGAGVKPARPAFQLGCNLHGANFRRTGDRATREHRPQDIAQTGVADIGRNRRNHLPQRRVILDLEQAVYANAAMGCNTTQIIAQQIDNHQVLGAILGRIAQDFRSLITWRRAFHRPGQQATAPPLDKQLWRQ